MMSGVGNSAEIRKSGLEVAHHLPGVGKNLQDHVAAGIKHMSPSNKPYGLSWSALPYLAKSVVDYALFRRGLFASNIMEAGGFLRSRPGLSRPDLQFIFMPAHRAPGRIFAPGHGYTLFAAVMRPKSRGHVGLSNDPFMKPVIDLNLLGEDEDLQLLLSGIKTARRILAAPAFDPYCGEEVKPGPKIQSDDELIKFIRQSAQTVFHPIGTCKMGIDEAAVVDPKLRVHGLGKLRVIDASIMPTIIGGNTSAPTMMIAEKASDMILNS
jgi:choline dehydrogenase-like flavoprotein